MEANVWRIDWNDGMSVGIPEIDEDHKRFILLVNQFNQAVAELMDLTEVKKRLQLIIDDASQHFAHEERLFKEWHYPDTEEHAAKHAQIISALQHMKSTPVSYDLYPVWIDAGLTINKMLIGHILKEDMKYADFRRGCPTIR
jgi:hemerythrin